MMMPESELVAYLHEWAAKASSFRLNDYGDWAREHEAPSPSTLILRFGSWSEAMRAAGLEDRITSIRQQRRVISESELWSSVVAYLRADRERDSFADFGAWMRQQGLPSAATVRARLGKWSSVREMAEKIINYSAGKITEPWDFADEVLAIVPGEGPRREHTDDACYAALQRVATVLEGPITVAQYDKVRAPNEPSSGVLMKRYGSWRESLQWADLADRATPPRS